MEEILLAAHSRYEGLARRAPGKSRYQEKIGGASAARRGCKAADVQIPRAPGIDGRAAGQYFAREESAHQPVERSALAGEAYFFARLFEIGLIALVAGLLENIDAGVIDVVA